MGFYVPAPESIPVGIQSARHAIPNMNTYLLYTMLYDIYIYSYIIYCLFHMYMRGIRST